MEEKKLRSRLNKIRDAMKVITNEINLIYNENAECDEHSITNKESNENEINKETNGLHSKKS